jgi:hypothetical protein
MRGSRRELEIGVLRGREALGKSAIPKVLKLIKCHFIYEYSGGEIIEKSLSRKGHIICI